MAFDTKFELDNCNAIQYESATLTLSGITEIATTGQLKYNSGNTTTFTRYSIPDVDYVTGYTDNKLGTYYSCSEIDFFTGTTLPNNYYNKTQINAYSATTQTLINSKLSGVTNGLNVSNYNVGLGGNLVNDTTISGLSGTYGISLGDDDSLLNHFKVLTDSTGIQLIGKNSGGIDLITCGNGNVCLRNLSTGGVFLNSLSCGVFLQNGSNCLDITNNDIIITNSSTNKGIEYASDYSNNYTSRSLTDKQYVDTVATGLNAKSAVIFATTGNTNLSGHTYIDGFLTEDGQRILVKDQTTGSTNGVYIATGATWYRSDDFDFLPSGEVLNGDLIPVISGYTHTASQWILSTPDPIESGDTLTFTKFTQLLQLGAGNGIDIQTLGATQNISVKTVNGLSILSGSVGLGGILCENASILGSSYSIEFGNSTTGIGSFLVDNKNGSGDITLRDTAGNGIYLDGLGGGGIYLNDNGGGGIYLDDKDQGGGIYVTDTGQGGVYLESNSNIITRIKNSSNVTQFTFDLSNLNGALFTDSRATKAGIIYAADYSSNFTDRSLVDKGYVSGVIASSAITASNGLTKTGNTVCLGGTIINTFTSILPDTDETYAMSIGNSSCGFFSVSLTSKSQGTYQDTMYAEDGTIKLYHRNTTDDYTLELTLQENPNQEIQISSNDPDFIGIIYGADYSSNYTARSLVDVAYVTGLTSQSKHSKTVITGSTTLSTGSTYVILVNHTSSSTVTLPATPISGQAFKIKDVSGNALTNIITISGNGNNIDGSSTVNINTDYGALELMFDETLVEWYILSFVT